MSNITRDPRSIVLAAIILCIVASLTGAHGQDKNLGGLKIGAVNPARLLAEYKYTKASNDELNKTQADTLAILQTWQQNPLLSPADQEALSALVVQEATPAGLDANKKTQKQKLLDQSKNLFNEYLALQTKPQLAPAESDRLKELTKIEGDTKKRISDRQQAVQDDLQKKAQDIRTKMDKDVREALNKIAKAKGYNLIFSSEVLLYAENDITDDVLKELNK